MKTFIFTFCIYGLLVVFSGQVYSQVEIKGTGSTSSTKAFVVKNNSNDTSMVILDNGNVGIDTTLPAQKLHVKGTVYSSSGGFMFPDGSVSTTAFTPTTYFHVYTVAVFGGDFNTITAALNACGVTDPTKRYLIRVMPGIYNETVYCKKYVHLKGSGKYTCTITDGVVTTDSCVVEDFDIKHGVICINASPTLLHNIITNTSADNSPGIYVHTMYGDTAKPWIKENEILDCNGYGIHCDGFHADAWIIANKIERNDWGGIRCDNSSPTISNNQIVYNQVVGIILQGAMGTPSEPTIDDNVIGFTGYMAGGVGISMGGYAEPRIIANDIYLNECGIWINNNTQPSIIGNDINYNFEAGIRCLSNGASKPVVITGNHIHSNAGNAGNQPAGIWVQLMPALPPPNYWGSPIISQNVITNNDRNGAGRPDIDYSACQVGFIPMISLNVYDIIIRAGGMPGIGNYNVTSAGGMINP